MLKNVVVPLLGMVALAAVAGCAGTSTAPSAAVTAPADVAGTWTGALVVGGTSVTMILEQTGASVTGDLRVPGRADISGPIVGTVEGNTIKLRAQSGESTPLLTVQGDHITGNVRGTALDLRRSR